MAAGRWGLQQGMLYALLVDYLVKLPPDLPYNGWTCFLTIFRMVRVPHLRLDSRACSARAGLPRVSMTQF